MHPQSRTGAALAVLLLSTVALAAPQQIPQGGTGPRPGAPVGSGTAPLPTAGMGANTSPEGSPSPPGAVSPADGTISAFAQWWGPLRGTLPERIRGVCTDFQDTAEVANWCTRYRG